MLTRPDYKGRPAWIKDRVPITSCARASPQHTHPLDEGHLEHISVHTHLWPPQIIHLQLSVLLQHLSYTWRMVAKVFCDRRKSIPAHRPV